MLDQVRQAGARKLEQLRAAADRECKQLTRRLAHADRDAAQARDDEGMERQPTLDLFDAFGTTEKTLHANLGGHAGTPWFEVDDGARFFARHLK